MAKSTNLLARRVVFGPHGTAKPVSSIGSADATLYLVLNDTLRFSSTLLWLLQSSENMESRCRHSQADCRAALKSAFLDPKLL